MLLRNNRFFNLHTLLHQYFVKLFILEFFIIKISTHVYLGKNCYNLFRLIDLLTHQKDLTTVDWLYHQMQKYLGEHLVRLGLVRDGLSEVDIKV